MLKRNVLILLIVVFMAAFNVSNICYGQENSLHGSMEFTGMCDASAAVAIDASTFVVASDEDNILRFYRHDSVEREPIQIFDLGPFLKLDVKHPEADIEAAAQIGNRIYWITSHARNKKAKLRTSRYKFFATQIDAVAGKFVVTFVGQPYESLVDDLITAPSLNRFALQQASRRGAKLEHSLNIEGLAAMPDGSLLIAFRSPVPDGKALLVSLENPQEMVAGKAARLGDAILLHLQGRGIRAMAYMDQLNAYIIIAGAFDSRNDFKVFTWSGRRSDDPLLIESVDLHGLHPETVIVYPHGKAIVQLLSDDGTRRVDSGRCKDADSTERRFRSMWVTPK